MEHYHIRLDTDQVEILQQILKEDYEQLLYCFELAKVTNKPHIHAYVVTSLKVQALRKRIKSFDFKQGRYSLSIVDQRDCEFGNHMYSLKLLAYITKDGEYLNEGIPEEVLEKAIAQEKELKKNYKEACKKKKNIIDELVDYVKTQVEKFPPGPKEKVHINSIMLFVLQYYVEKQMIVRRAMIQAYSDTIYLRLYPDDADYLVGLWMTPVSRR